MTAIAEPRKTNARQHPLTWCNRERTVASATTIYHGSWVGLNELGTVVPGNLATNTFGRAHCPNLVSATAGQKVDIEHGAFFWEPGSLATADVGAIVYAADNQTAAGTIGSSLAPAGILLEVTSDGACVLSGPGVGTLEIGS